MRRRINIRLTREDQGAVSRWWRLMIPAVAIVVLALLAAEKAYQQVVPITSDLVRHAAQ